MAVIAADEAERPLGYWIARVRPDRTVWFQVDILAWIQKPSGPGRRDVATYALCVLPEGGVREIPIEDLRRTKR